MSDPIEKKGDETAAENPPAETRPDALDLASVASTLPPGGNGAPAGTSEPPKTTVASVVNKVANAARTVAARVRSHGKTGFRKGKPCSDGTCGRCKKCGGQGAFGSPAPAPSAPIESRPVAESAASPDAVAPADDSRGTVGDYQHYGKAGAHAVNGIVNHFTNGLARDVHATCAALHSDAARMLERVNRLRVPDAHKSDLELFYAAAAMEVGAPKGGGIIALGVSIHANLFAHWRAGADEIRAELAAMRRDAGQVSHKPSSHTHTPQGAQTPAPAAQSDGKLFPD